MCHSMLCMIIFFVGHCVSQKLRTQTPKNLELPKTQTLGFAENSDPQLPWSQRFFLIFFCERDEKQAAKRRQRVAKATRRERKTSGYLSLESHFHADDRVRI